MDVVTRQPYQKTQEQAQQQQQQEVPPAEGVLKWMPLPPNVSSSCPPGLEYLTAVEYLLVDQDVELIEIVTDIECASKYKIVNDQKQSVYFATEESEFCERMCFHNKRGFVMHIWDSAGKEVIRINRPFQCLAGMRCLACFDCCAMTIEVEAPVGQVVGRVRQTESAWTAHYDVLSPTDEVVLKIRGPACVWHSVCCVRDQDFKIMTPDLSQTIGKISRKWGGCARAIFTSAEKFGISFPLDLDVRTKATLFGALFLIDFMIYQGFK